MQLKPLLFSAMFQTSFSFTQAPQLCLSPSERPDVQVFESFCLLDNNVLISEGSLRSVDQQIVAPAVRYIHRIMLHITGE